MLEAYSAYKSYLLLCEEMEEEAVNAENKDWEEHYILLIDRYWDSKNVTD